MNALGVSRVTSGDSFPKQWLVFLHGILGSGANWRSFARQLLARCPSWGALLVDLRLHGDSVGFSRPHSIAAAASDVVQWLRHSELGVSSAQAICGHSFGGKVAIELASQLGKERCPPRHVFVVDSTPGARLDRRGSTEVVHIVDLLTRLPPAFGDRAEFTAWMEGHGVTRPIAMWLAMNVRPVPNTTRFEFRVDVRGISELLDDYFAHDTWSLMHALASDAATSFHMITGGASDVVSAEDRQRIRKVPHATLEVIEGAGHWVHVDAPLALQAALVARLSMPS